MDFDVPFMFDTLAAILSRGLGVSLLLVFITTVIAIPVGFVLGIVRYRQIRFLQKVIELLSSFLRGTPFVVQIFIAYNGMPRILNYMSETYHWGIDFFSVSAFAYAVVIFSINYCMIFCEIFRSALSSVNRGQFEAAASVGLTPFQTYAEIIAPQALVSAVPNLCNAILNLFKGTSLVYFLAIQDITGVAKTYAASGYKYIEAYSAVLITYIAVCFIMQRLFTLCEKHLKVYKAARA